MFNSVNLGNFCSQSRKERSGDFGERAGCASNLYLPSCTYYVPEFSTVSSFLPQAPSRQISYPYSANLSQVQPVREVSYGLDPSNKWHPRSGYASCYSAEELMHRDCLPPSTMTEMLMKNESAYSHHHPPSGNPPPPTGFYSGVSKNSVLPQGFDRFFENAYCAAENPLEGCPQKAPSKLESDPAAAAAAAAAEPTALSSRGEQGVDPEDEEESTNPASSASSSSANKDAGKASSASR